MDLNSMMLPLLMSMMGKGGDKGGEGGMPDMENMAKLIAGMKNGDSSALFSMLPQNDKTKGILEMAKMMSRINEKPQEKSDIVVGDKKTRMFSDENPFSAISGFCGSEVNSALKKLFEQNKS
jgi:hypothetical protein